MKTTHKDMKQHHWEIEIKCVNVTHVSEGGEMIFFAFGFDFSLALVEFKILFLVCLFFFSGEHWHGFKASYCYPPQMCG